MARKARIVTINDKPYRFSKFEMELNNKIFTEDDTNG
ncbi:phage protein [Staphylococcus aureus]|nr:PVL phage protein [Staphylococcus aureus]CAC6908067.1 phage protein [Staphylococcus aureus]SAN14129.1 phage protein [Staphylococcus aureus]SAO88995.1 phage protein [Staphylococcus aureus]